MHDNYIRLTVEYRDPTLEGTSNHFVNITNLAAQSYLIKSHCLGVSSNSLLRKPMIIPEYILVSRSESILISY